MILDEAQNTTLAQMKMFLTPGEGSDGRHRRSVAIRSRARAKNGLTDAVARLRRFATSRRGVHHQDVCRHPLVEQIVRAYEGPSRAGPRAEGQIRTDRGARPGAQHAPNTARSASEFDRRALPVRRAPRARRPHHLAHAASMLDDANCASVQRRAQRTRARESRWCSYGSRAARLHSGSAIPRRPTGSRPTRRRRWGPRASCTSTPGARRVASREESHRRASRLVVHGALHLCGFR